MELITSTYVGKEVDHIPDQVQGSVNGTASHKQVLGSQNKNIVLVEICEGMENMEFDSTYSGMNGLEECANFGLEVIAVYSNKATAVSGQKRSSITCDQEVPCDEEEWQGSFEVVQQARGPSLEISASWRGCQVDSFYVVWTRDKGDDPCKDYSG